MGLSISHFDRPQRQRAQAEEDRRERDQGKREGMRGVDLREEHVFIN